MQILYIFYNLFYHYGLGVVCWVLWSMRNKMSIEKKLVKLPCNIIDNIVSPMEGLVTKGGAGACDGSC
jgi:hypothetical protein